MRIYFDIIGSGFKNGCIINYYHDYSDVYPATYYVDKFAERGYEEVTVEISYKEYEIVTGIDMMVPKFRKTVNKQSITWQSVKGFHVVQDFEVKKESY